MFYWVVDDDVGPLPTYGSLFRGMAFLITGNDKEVGQAAARGNLFCLI